MLPLLSSTMPDDLRKEKEYYTVGGCGGNIAWHTEDDQMEIADQEILLRDMRVYAQAIIGVAGFQSGSRFPIFISLEPMMKALA